MVAFANRLALAVMAAAVPPQVSAPALWSVSFFNVFIKIT